MTFKNYYTTSSAIALKYDKEKKDPPKVIASGKGEIAENIIRIAKKNNIPIHQNEELVDILEILEINSYIPLEAYSAVAEILSLIYGFKNDKNT